MTDKILLKRSLTSGSIPSTSSLDVGELAINVPDGKLYLKQSGSQGETVRSLLTLDTPMSGSVLLTGSVITTQQITAPSFTGSLFGTSSWATNAISSSFASSTSNATSASYVEYSNVANKPTLVSASSQVDVTQTTNIATIATTGSNTFTGIQNISNTTNSTNYTDGALVVTGGVGIGKDVNISGSLNVIGLLTAISMSTQYVTSSQYTVGTSRIILNDDDLVRFAGISVIDSGSTYGTGSLLWDSLNNRWIYETDDLAYNSAILIAGPKNTGTLGNEVGLISGRIPVATGDDHIDTALASSSLYIDFADRKTYVEAGLYVTGSITASNNISGTLIGTSSWASNAVTSSYVEFANIANKPTLVSSSAQINTGSFTGSFIGEHTGSLFANSGSIRFTTGSIQIGQFTPKFPSAINLDVARTNNTILSVTESVDNKVSVFWSVGTSLADTTLNVSAEAGSGQPAAAGKLKLSFGQASTWEFFGATTTISNTAFIKSTLPNTYFVPSTNGLSIRNSGNTKDNLIVTDAGDVTITGSLFVKGAAGITGSLSGSVTGSLFGTSSWASNAVTSSYVEFANIANKPTLVSSSAQINTGSFSGSFTGSVFATTGSIVIHTGSIQLGYSASLAPATAPLVIDTAGYDNTAIKFTKGPFTSVYYGSILLVDSNPMLYLQAGGGIVIGPSNNNAFVFSSAIDSEVRNTLKSNGNLLFITDVSTSQIRFRNSGNTRNNLLITDLGDVTITGSLFVKGAAGITGSLSGSVTGSLFGTSSWATNAITASYVEFTNVANKPTLISSSLQINTGSFSGSFTGELIGTSSWATNAVSSSVSLRSAIISTGSAPSNPITDELWYDDTTGKTYIYYVSASVGQWVLQSDPTYDPGPSLQNLQDVTDLGAITNNAITITNTTPSTSNTTGALIVSGGLGVSGSIYTTKVSATQISGSVVSASAYVGQKSSIIYVIDGGGLTIQTGVKGDLYIPFDCTVNEWVLLADQAGSIVIDVWSDVYGSYPPTGIDSIAGTDLPTLSSVNKNKSTALTGWNPNISAGNTLRFNVNSATSITRVTLTLNVTKT